MGPCCRCHWPLVPLAAAPGPSAGRDVSQLSGALGHWNYEKDCYTDCVVHTGFKCKVKVKVTLTELHYWLCRIQGFHRQHMSTSAASISIIFHLDNNKNVPNSMDVLYFM